MGESDEILALCISLSPCCFCLISFSLFSRSVWWSLNEAKRVGAEVLEDTDVLRLPSVNPLRNPRRVPRLPVDAAGDAAELRLTVGCSSKSPVLLLLLSVTVSELPRIIGIGVGAVTWVNWGGCVTLGDDVPISLDKDERGDCAAFNWRWFIDCLRDEGSDL